MDNLNKLRQASTDCETFMPISPLTMYSNNECKVEERSTKEISGVLRLLSKTPKSLASTLE